MGTSEHSHGSKNSTSDNFNVVVAAAAYNTAVEAAAAHNTAVEIAAAHNTAGTRCLTLILRLHHEWPF